MAIWTIRYFAPGDLTGVEKTCAAWRITDLSLRLNNQVADTLEVTMNGTAIDAVVDTWAYGGICTLAKDGERWFYGRVVSNPRTGSGRAESMSYTLAGPWWWLENSVYEQAWNIRNEAGELIPTFKGMAILCQAGDGTRMTTGAQMADAINQVIARGAPIVLGTIEPDVIPTFSEVKDLTCAEVVKTLMKWSPNAVAWFDYTTVPVPTLHITLRANMPVVTTAIGAIDGPESLDITPRYDLQAPACVIKYEAQNNVDGVASTSITIDKAPAEATGLEFGAVVVTVELGGASSTVQRQRVVAKTILEGSVSWWTEKLPYLSGVTGLELVPPNTGHIIPGPSGQHLPRELVSGSAPAWITTSTTEEIEVQAYVQGTASDGDGNETITYAKQLVSVKVKGTDLSDRVYSHVSDFTYAEAAPPNLAAQLYDAVRVLHWEGRLQFVADECTSAWRPGKLLNIAAGHSAWATMDAQVQQVTHNLTDGITSISFGPAEHLAPQDFVELLRASRGRPAATRVGSRVSGDSEKPVVEGGGETAIQRGGLAGDAASKRSMSTKDAANSKIVLDTTAEDSGGLPTVTVVHQNGAKIETKASTDKAVHSITDGATSGVKTITLSTEDITAPEGGGREIKLREVPWCDPDDPTTPKMVLLLCSEPYEAAGGEE